jgi:hypothetical protein
LLATGCASATLIERKYERDIWELEKSLEIMEPEWDFFTTIQCSGFNTCVQGCSEEAIARLNPTFRRYLIIYFYRKYINVRI